jgi:protein transport protein SEC23
MLFAGGAATEGSGLIVSPELKESLRSHHDLEKGLSKHSKKATKVF